MALRRSISSPPKATLTSMPSNFSPSYSSLCFAKFDSRVLMSLPSRVIVRQSPALHEQMVLTKIILIPIPITRAASAYCQKSDQATIPRAERRRRTPMLSPISEPTRSGPQTRPKKQGMMTKNAHHPSNEKQKSNTPARLRIHNRPAAMKASPNTILKVFFISFIISVHRQKSADAE